MHAGLFERATCLEADWSRIDWAQGTWKWNKWGRTANVHFENARFGLDASRQPYYNAAHFANASFDAITCVQGACRVSACEHRLWPS